MGVYSCTYSCGYVNACRSGVIVEYLPASLFILYFETGSLTEPEEH